MYFDAIILTWTSLLKAGNEGVRMALAACTHRTGRHAPGKWAQRTGEEIGRNHDTSELDKLDISYGIICFPHLWVWLSSDFLSQNTLFLLLALQSSWQTPLALGSAVRAGWASCVSGQHEPEGLTRACNSAAGLAEGQAPDPHRPSPFWGFLKSPGEKLPLSSSHSRRFSLFNSFFRSLPAPCPSRLGDAELDKMYVGWWAFCHLGTWPAWKCSRRDRLAWDSGSKFWWREPLDAALTATRAPCPCPQEQSSSRSSHAGLGFGRYQKRLENRLTQIREPFTSSECDTRSRRLTWETSKSAPILPAEQFRQNGCYSVSFLGSKQAKMATLVHGDSCWGHNQL